jgi:hypothetical protein
MRAGDGLPRDLRDSDCDLVAEKSPSAHFLNIPRAERIKFSAGWLVLMLAAKFQRTGSSEVDGSSLLVGRSCKEPHPCRREESQPLEGKRPITELNLQFDPEAHRPLSAAMRPKSAV